MRSERPVLLVENRARAVTTRRSREVEVDQLPPAAFASALAGPAVWRVRIVAEASTDLPTFDGVGAEREAANDSRAFDVVPTLTEIRRDEEERVVVAFQDDRDEWGTLGFDAEHAEDRLARSSRNFASQDCSGLDRDEWIAPDRPVKLDDLRHPSPVPHLHLRDRR